MNLHMGPWVRTGVAILAGFLSMIIVVVLGTALVAALFVPGGMAGMRDEALVLPAGYLVANLIVSLLAAVAGGWVASRMDAPGRWLPVLGVAVLVFAMSLTNQAVPRAGSGAELTWYPWALLVLGAGGALVGGWVRMRSAVWSP